VTYTVTDKTSQPTLRSKLQHFDLLQIHMTNVVVLRSNVKYQAHDI